MEKDKPHTKCLGMSVGHLARMLTAALTLSNLTKAQDGMSVSIGFMDEQQSVSVDHCGGDLSNDMEYGGNRSPDCFDFTAGLTDDVWGDGAQISDTCNSSQQNSLYAWKRLTETTEINTLVVVAGWRHSYPGTDTELTDPYLNVGFVDFDPNNEYKDDAKMDDVNWIDLGRDNLSQLKSLQDDTRIGSFIIFRYWCEAQNNECKKIKLHLVSCYTEYLVDPMLLTPQIPGRLDSWQNWSRQLVLEKGPFTINCAGTDLEELQGSKTCFKLNGPQPRFASDVDQNIENIVSISAIPGFYYDNTNNEGPSDSNQITSFKISARNREDNSLIWKEQSPEFADFYSKILTNIFDDTTFTLTEDNFLKCDQNTDMDRNFIGYFLLSTTLNAYVAPCSSAATCNDPNCYTVTEIEDTFIQPLLYSEVPRVLTLTVTSEPACAEQFYIVLAAVESPFTAAVIYDAYSGTVTVDPATLNSVDEGVITVGFTLNYLNDQSVLIEMEKTLSYVNCESKFLTIPSDEIWEFMKDQTSNERTLETFFKDPAITGSIYVDQVRAVCGDLRLTVQGSPVSEQRTVSISTDVDYNEGIIGLIFENQDQDQVGDQEVEVTISGQFELLPTQTYSYTVYVIIYDCKIQEIYWNDVQITDVLIGTGQQQFFLEMWGFNEDQGDIQLSIIQDPVQSSLEGIASVTPNDIIWGDWSDYSVRSFTLNVDTTTVQNPVLYNDLNLVMSFLGDGSFSNAICDVSHPFSLNFVAPVNCPSYLTTPTLPTIEPIMLRSDVTSIELPSFLSSDAGTIDSSCGNLIFQTTQTGDGLALLTTTETIESGLITLNVDVTGETATAGTFNVVVTYGFENSETSVSVTVNFVIDDCSTYLVDQPISDIGIIINKSGTQSFTVPSYSEILPNPAPQSCGELLLAVDYSGSSVEVWNVDWQKVELVAILDTGLVSVDTNTIATSATIFYFGFYYKFSIDEEANILKQIALAVVNCEDYLMTPVLPTIEPFLLRSTGTPVQLPSFISSTAGTIDPGCGNLILQPLTGDGIDYITATETVDDSGLMTGVTLNVDLATTTPAGTFNFVVAYSFESVPTAIMQVQVAFEIIDCQSSLTVPTISDLGPLVNRSGIQVLTIPSMSEILPVDAPDACGQIQQWVRSQDEGLNDDGKVEIIGSLWHGTMDVDTNTLAISATELDIEIQYWFELEDATTSQTGRIIREIPLIVISCANYLTTPVLPTIEPFLLRSAGTPVELPSFLSSDVLNGQTTIDSACGELIIETYTVNQVEAYITATTTYDLNGLMTGITFNVDPTDETATAGTFTVTVDYYFEVDSEQEKSSFTVIFDIIDCQSFIEVKQIVDPNIFSILLNGNVEFFDLPIFRSESYTASSEINSLCGTLELSLETANDDDISVIAQILTEPETASNFYTTATLKIDTALFTTSATVYDVNYVWRFVNDPDGSLSAPFQINFFSCQQYLSIQELSPDNFSLDLGQEAEEFDLAALLSTQVLLGEVAIDQNCGSLLMALVGIESSVASVTAITNEATGRVTGSRLWIDPSAEAAIAGFFPVTMIWSFENDQSAMVQAAPIMISFVDVSDPCLGAQISFSNTENFESTYTIYAGSINEQSSDSSESLESSEEGEESTTDSDEVSTEEESIVTEVIEQEEKFTIEWPEFSADLPDGCITTILPTISFLGGSSLGESWFEYDPNKQELTIDTKNSAITALKNDDLILVTVKVALIDSSSEEELSDAEIKFAIKFQTPYVEEKAEAEAEPEEEDVSSVIETEDAEEVDQFVFAGVVMDKDKIEKKKRVQQVIVKEVFQPIKATVDLADESGNIRIMFSRPIVLNLDGIDANESKRRLLSETYTEEEKLKLANILKITYNTETEDGPDKSEIISKEVVKATDLLLELKLVHSKPLAVSRDAGVSDSISIEFDNSIWDDPETEIEVNQGKPLVIKLPRQMDAAEAAVIASTMDSANGAANTVATGNVVLNIVLGSSLKLLWGMINTLQFVVFFTEWQVQIPPNALLAIKTFRTIALGEFIPYEWLTEPLSEVFQATEDEEENSKSSILVNMGVMLVVLGVLVIMAIIVSLLVKTCKTGSKIHGLFTKIKGKVFWNAILRFILQSYLKIALATTFSLYLASFGTDMEIVNFVISIAILLILFGMPILFAILLHKNRNMLSTEKLKAKIGSIYLGIRVTNVSHRFYSSVFLIRRMTYAILTIACIYNPNILIHVFLLTNIFYVVYLGWSNPNDTGIGRRMEFLNEVGLQIITYHLALFPLAPTSDDEELAGWSMVGAICGVFFCNLVVMVCMTIIGLKRKLYLRKLSKVQKVMIEKFLESKLRKSLTLMAQKECQVGPQQLSSSSGDSESEEDSIPERKPRRMSISAAAAISTMNVSLDQESTSSPASPTKFINPKLTQMQPPDLASQAVFDNQSNQAYKGESNIEISSIQISEISDICLSVVDEEPEEENNPEKKRFNIIQLMKKQECAPEERKQAQEEVAEMYINPDVPVQDIDQMIKNIEADFFGASSPTQKPPVSSDGFN